MDGAALETVDAREAAGDEEISAAAALVGANAVTGNGSPAILRDTGATRKLPTFESAFEEKAPPPDESDVYSKPVSQTGKFDEWRLTSDSQK